MLLNRSSPSYTAILPDDEALLRLVEYGFINRRLKHYLESHYDREPTSVPGLNSVNSSIRCSNSSTLNLVDVVFGEIGHRKCVVDLFAVNGHDPFTRDAHLLKDPENLLFVFQRTIAPARPLNRSVLAVNRLVVMEPIGQYLPNRLAKVASVRWTSESSV